MTETQTDIENNTNLEYKQNGSTGRDRNRFYNMKYHWTNSSQSG